MEPRGDGEADVHRPAGRHDGVGIEAAVRAHGELAAGAGMPDPPDRLSQEVGGTPDGGRPSLAQARHQHVARARRDREQGVVAAHLGVPVVEGTLLLEAVRLADRRVEVEREGRRAGAGAGSPCPGEEVPAHRVELADMAPAEAAQEGAEGGRCLHGEAEDLRRPACPEHCCVVDAIAAGERRQDERHELVARVRGTRLLPEVEVLLDELLHAKVRGQRRGQEEARVGHQLRPVERGVNPVEAVGRSHPAGAPLFGVMAVLQHHHSRSAGHLFCCPG
jgi:hypothetical protein